MHPNIVINPCGPEIRPGESIIQCSLCTNWTHMDGAIHENPVTNEKFFKFPHHSWIFFQKFLKLFKSYVVEISFKATDAANICCEACATNLFPNFID